MIDKSAFTCIIQTYTCILQLYVCKVKVLIIIITISHEKGGSCSLFTEQQYYEGTTNYLPNCNLICFHMDWKCYSSYFPYPNPRKYYWSNSITYLFITYFCSDSVLTIVLISIGIIFRIFFINHITYLLISFCVYYCFVAIRRVNCARNKKWLHN